MSVSQALDTIFYPTFSVIRDKLDDSVVVKFIVTDYHYPNVHTENFMLENECRPPLRKHMNS